MFIFFYQQRYNISQIWEKIKEALKTDVNPNKVHLSKPIFSISAVIGLLQTHPVPRKFTNIYVSITRLKWVS